MNLLQVGIKLGPESIQSFIDDFVRIDCITISDIQLRDDMILINRIKYKSFGTLSIGLEIDRLEDGIVSISVKKIKAMNIPISLVPVNILIKMILSKSNIPGVVWNESQIQIDLRVIFEKFNLNFLSLNVKDIQITSESINVLVNNVDLNMNKLLETTKRKNRKDNDLYDNSLNTNLVNNDKKLISESQNICEKFNDDFRAEHDCRDFDYGYEKHFQQYSRVRSRIYGIRFKNNENELLGKVIFLLPDVGVLAYRLLKDKRVRRTEKLLLVFTLSCLLNPFGGINKKFPLLNKLDEGLLIIFTLSKIFSCVDKKVIKYHFDGSEDTLNFLIDIFDVFSQFMGLDKINRVYSVLEKFIK